MPVERGKIREFAKATMSDNQAYQGANPVIPPTFLTTAGFFWQTAESKEAGAHGLDPKRTLHAEQEYIFHGEPPRAGDELTAQARILDRYTKEGRRGGTLTFVETVVEFRDKTGRLVAEQRSTGVQTSHAPKEA
ncbi:MULTISPECIES: FAS1-like dehydratase domain-containing protein [Rhodococcus]|uniref:MaoC family dehydratase N-terminal domain-containing protein n=1 Tax=Rhodococcus pseudokoreensis TaxID=2811421 RepID=A0A974WCN9_9NOCA|nr:MULTISPECIES: MaoC family dehydratase N-terminal domain-containing protein [Rhodococcus]MBV6760730.1 MaoC family dehydratase N-terminal domain-containing protein [Rhodococcus opacus]QSE95416.1 MaoC family dehydratase N-terminal domain-containing protein [Rhodococcus pseudokoreensis]